MLGSLETTAGICGLRPVPFAGGKWLLWDGGIDNRADLRKTTSQQRSTEQDPGLVADLYERQGVKTFEGIVGDWAAGIWCESENTLILAQGLSRHALPVLSCQRKPSGMVYGSRSRCSFFLAVRGPAVRVLRRGLDDIFPRGPPYTVSRNF